VKEWGEGEEGEVFVQWAALLCACRGGVSPPNRGGGGSFCAVGSFAVGSGGRN